MNLYFRFLKTLLVALLQGKSSGLESQNMQYRVWLNDIDLNFHMNNGRYLTVMDLGHLQFTVRTGLLRKMLKNRWKLVVANSLINYKKSLTPFQAFELQTSLISWDENSLYFEKRFVANETLMAIGYVKVIIRSHTENISPAEFLGDMGARFNYPPKPVPDFFLNLDPLA
jgi:acyl-CoA thioesterase FadM